MYYVIHYVVENGIGLLGDVSLGTLQATQTEGDWKYRVYQFSHIVCRLVIASDYDAMLWKALVGRHPVLEFQARVESRRVGLGKGMFVISRRKCKRCEDDGRARAST